MNTSKFLFLLLSLNAVMANVVSAQDDLITKFGTDPYFFPSNQIRSRNPDSASTLKSTGLFANDTLWDGQDRWRTGSYQRNVTYNDFFDLRFRTEFIAPANLTNPDIQHDRPYASVVNLGLFYLSEVDNNEFSVGATLDAINEISLLENFHASVHGDFGFSGFGIDNYKVEDGIVISTEASWRQTKRFDFGYLVPFVETQYGTRERITLGLDFVKSPFEYDWISRDQTTGHLLGAPNFHGRPKDGWDFVAGGDLSYVTYDYFLDNTVSNVSREPLRYRIRVGSRYHYNGTTFFIGPTYLSPEFVGGGGQILQSLSVEMNF